MEYEAANSKNKIRRLSAGIKYRIITVSKKRPNKANPARMRTVEIKKIQKLCIVAILMEAFSANFGI